MFKIQIDNGQDAELPIITIQGIVTAWWTNELYLSSPTVNHIQIKIMGEIVKTYNFHNFVINQTVIIKAFLNAGSLVLIELEVIT